ncbi:MAG: hypothetical protein IPP72_17435 [Chitinophagaceae bacterium]|nr:hypothetical protein [Chitinophagaceae bacterium]
MKKGDVIQLSIIILALVTGFQTIQYFFNAITGLLYVIGSGEYVAGTLSPTLILFLIVLAQGSISWLLLTRSRAVADFIYEKANIGTSFKIMSRPEDLLFVLLIVAGFYFLLQNLPDLIRGIVAAFKSKAGSSGLNYYEPVTQTNWTSVIIKLLLPLALLMFAKPIAFYFAKNVSDEPVTIGDDLENIGKTDTTTS